jgi:tetratricopeptide (TPR) repeat protein
MNEKTLLYSALGFTAIAGAIGVYTMKSGGGGSVDAPPITSVTLTEASNTVASAEVPVRLTASDGTGLRLVALRAEAAVEDPLALTELHLTFENPGDRVLEGTFRIALPQGASLSRFAMKVGSTWQEGEVVEKQAARRAYEDFLHRRQDPALMEQGAGNEFSARVFPIPARGTKEIIVTYAEAIEAGAPYVLPLRGLPQLGALDVNVHVAGSIAAAGGRTEGTFGLHQQRFTPAGDFVVEGKHLARSPGLRSGDLAIARVVPFASSRPEPVGSAIVLVDTSASRGLGIADQVKTLSATLSRLPPDTRVVVACFDQEVVPAFEGKASEFGPKEAQAIALRGALGASDFEQAIAWAGDAARRSKATRVILLTDGVATAGETDAQKLRLKVEALRDAGVARMDAIAIGGIRDDGFLRTVVRGVLDRDGVVLDAKLGADALARRLGEATSSSIAVKVDGARWSWPEKLDGLQAGDEVLVYAELDASQPVRIDAGGQTFAPDLRAVPRPLVERAWAQAKIQSLVEAPKDGASATRQQIILLSTQHRVISPYTSLLVLETDFDYQRFGIDRNAKVDILAVQDGRVAVVESGRGPDDPRRWPSLPSRRKGEEASKTAAVDRASAPPMPAPPAATATAAASAAPAPRETEPAGPGSAADAAEFGTIGLLGVGGGGGGADDGIGRGTGEGFGRGGGSANRGGAAGHAASAAADLEATAVPAPAPAREERARLDRSPSPPPRPARRPVEASAGTVRPGILTIEAGISADEVQRVVRGAVPRLRSCYASELARDPSAGGRLELRVVVDRSGAVKTAEVVAAPGGSGLQACVTGVARSLQFAAPGSSEASFVQRFDLVGGGEGGDEPPPNVSKALPYEGRFKIVMDALARGDSDGALTEANHWHADQPGDVLSLVALGEVFEARHDLRSAARAYGSILELFSFRADSRRFAGERLERLTGEPRALALAVDTYAKAALQRPDHPASHRLYGYALLKQGEYEKAFEALKKGATRAYPTGRFRGVDRILKEDLGLAAAAWMHAEPGRAAEIRTRLREAGGVEESGPSLRFVLNWETDANDVDFHIHDGKGGHAYYSQMHLPSGGDLYADVTTGYGPECFTIRGPRERRAYPYTLQAHYYSRGPMGYGMGKLEVVEHDGQGGLSFDERPFVVMVDRAYVDMGKIDKATKLTASR